MKRKKSRCVFNTNEQTPEKGIVFCLDETKENAKGEIIDSLQVFTADPQEAEEHFIIPYGRDAVENSLSLIAYEIPDGVEYEFRSNGDLIMDDYDAMEEIESWQFFRSRNIKNSKGEEISDEKDTEEFKTQYEKFLKWWRDIKNSRNNEGKQYDDKS